MNGMVLFQVCYTQKSSTSQLFELGCIHHSVSCFIMRGSRKFCQRGFKFDNVPLFFVS